MCASLFSVKVRVKTDANQFEMDDRPNRPKQKEPNCQDIEDEDETMPEVGSFFSVLSYFIRIFF